MKSPPVIPIGLEYLATALEKHNHDVNIFDLCFVSSPIEELEKVFDKETYDIVGFTIRNIDTCHYFFNEFYLSEFKKLIDFIKKQEIPIILGGAGFSAMPNEILEYFQADFGIIGPGDITFPKFLDSWQKDKITSKIFDGWKDGIDNTLVHKRGDKVNYQQYLSNEGIIEYLSSQEKSWLKKKGKNCLSIITLIAIINALILYTIDLDYEILTLLFYAFTLRTTLFLFINIYYGFRD